MCRRTRRQRRAVAAVELAFLAPILLILLVGIWEVGRLVQVTQIVQNAAREGARQASTGLNTDAQVQTIVCQYLKDAGLPDYTASASTVVTVQDLTSPGTDVSAASQLDQLEVTVSVPFHDVQWIALHLVTSSGTKMNASATWGCMKDQAYPTTVTAPPGF